MKNSLAQRPAGTTVPAQSVVRLSPAVYADLEKLCPAVDPRNGDAVVAGFHNGVQFVLRKLREGFVHG